MPDEQEAKFVELPIDAKRGTVTTIVLPMGVEIPIYFGADKDGRVQLMFSAPSGTKLKTKKLTEGGEVG